MRPRAQWETIDLRRKSCLHFSIGWLNPLPKVSFLKEEGLQSTKSKQSVIDAAESGRLGGWVRKVYKFGWFCEGRGGGERKEAVSIGGGGGMRRRRLRVPGD